MNSNNLPSKRQMRFGEVIRAIVSDALVKDNVLSEQLDIRSVTVSFVNMSKDLKIASVYIMPLGGYDKNKVLELLNENKYIFQKSISNAKLNISRDFNTPDDSTPI